MFFFACFLLASRALKACIFRGLTKSSRTYLYSNHAGKNDNGGPLDDSQGPVNVCACGGVHRIRAEAMERRRALIESEVRVSANRVTGRND